MGRVWLLTAHDREGDAARAYGVVEYLRVGNLGARRVLCILAGVEAAVPEEGSRTRSQNYPQLAVGIEGRPEESFTLPKREEG